MIELYEECRMNKHSQIELKLFKECRKNGPAEEMLMLTWKEESKSMEVELSTKITLLQRLQ